MRPLNGRRCRTSLLHAWDCTARDRPGRQRGRWTNSPHFGTGVPLQAAAQALRVLCAAPGLAAITLTEVNSPGEWRSSAARLSERARIG
jgi:hypothetical protein